MLTAFGKAIPQWTGSPGSYIYAVSGNAGTELLAMDYFSEEEREKQEAFSSYRDAKLKPVTDALIKWGITPNMITGLGVLSLIIACLMPTEWGLMTWILLPIYSILDGLDGPLARATNSQNDAGAVIDMVADQAGVVLVPAAAIYHLGTNGIAALFFSSAYIGFIALVVFANSAGVSLFRFVRIKYFFYFVYCISIFFNYDLVTYFFYVTDVYYIGCLLLALYVIHKHFAAKTVTDTDPKGGR